MKSISITQARSDLDKLIANVNANSAPVLLTNSRGKNAVLISEDDWNAIQETLYLNTISGLSESILQTDREEDSGSVYDPNEEW